ncbi:MAG: hypothetical protein JSR78_15255 [Proteobacteria bacterium]|nr:hypothetical protein [Pseudomonadota bacterium]
MKPEAEMDDDSRIMASLLRLGDRGHKPAPQKSNRARPAHNPRTLKGRAALESASIAPDGRVKRRTSARTAQLNVTIEETLKARLVAASREHGERIVDIVERALAVELDKLGGKRA